MCLTMSKQRQLRATVFSALLLIQIIAPISYASSPDLPEFEMDTDVDLELLASLGLTPSTEVKNGWFEASEDTGAIELLYRSASVVPLQDWQAWTNSPSTLSGWHVLTHSYPIPTEWFYELEDAGIECQSYMPPNGFQCNLAGHSIADLSKLDVEGLVQLDSVDKLREDLVRGVLGLEKNHFNPYSVEGRAIVSIVLSGTELPDGFNQRDDLVIDSHSDRFVTVVAENSGIVWLAEQQAVEWIETRPYFTLNNDVAATIIHADDLQNSTTMSGTNAAWNGLDGSGIVVTVADTGLDNGVNNSAMHPDFADHIKGILSFPLPASSCSWTSPTNPGGCDDGANDDHGHGTHVAGSVLGDGTTWTSVKGMAPEAQLLVHAIEHSGGLGPIPNDLGDMFDLAVANGSRVHTNSWGSAVSGAYTISSMQADRSALEHDNLVIMFAAANEGTDGDGDGKIDEDSMGSPATAKNVISIGASENLRTNATGSWPAWASNNISGMATFSSRGPTDDGRLKPDFSAPGTNILSTRSRDPGAGGSGDYTFMSGTSMATPVSAGATALLLQHLIDNLNHPNPSSALIKGIFAATSVDMIGQYNDVTDGAGQTAPNNHEGWGRIHLLDAASASFVDRESLSTGEERGWSVSVPSSAPTMQIMLSYNDASSSPAVSANLINDVDLAVKDPNGTWTNLSDNINNLKGLTFDSPAQGTWEVHIIGTSVASGPQFFSVAINSGYTMVNLTQDADFDGTVDEDDDCAFTFGISTNDRKGCPDTDGDGYSNPSFNWTLSDGADAFISEITQWADQDTDGFGDNPTGNNPDGCPSITGNSTGDRYGCTDSDGDTFSDPESSLGGWTIAQGADGCASVFGTSNIDRNGCPDEDGDGASDPDSSWSVAQGADAFLGDITQWADADTDGYGDNPPPATEGDACPAITGNSTTDRFGCLDNDGDGYSNPDGSWTTASGADQFINDATQWVDSDGDGLGDNWANTSWNSTRSSHWPGQWIENANIPDASPYDFDNDGFEEQSIANAVEGIGWDDCPTISGTSHADRNGCIDSDGDGYSDADSSWTVAQGADAFVADATQWADQDADGYGDNATGNNPDACPTTYGESTTAGALGCSDNDGDGYADFIDAFPTIDSQWADSDSDGFGDNPSGYHPDACVSTFGSSSVDRKGCPDSDADGTSDPDPSGAYGSAYTTADGADVWPNDSTQWVDSDGDGYGDNAFGTNPDGCVNVNGSSSIDRFGCSDSDGDGYSDADSGWTVADGADAFVSDPSRWSDGDNDGISDQLDDACPSLSGNSTIDRIGCPDTDGDGYSDGDANWTPANGSDMFRTDATQWNDSDGDGYGDNAAGTLADDCPSVAGTSWQNNTLGCTDTDSDGWADQEDSFVDDFTQWSDIDGDGFGDNLGGTTPDACPGEFGNSSMGNRLGCPDADGDGWDDIIDALPSTPNQWLDQDGDGFGDNATGPQPDACPGVAGNSTHDRFGCLDSDGDGMSDDNDAFPNDGTRSQDTDQDGWDDLEDNCFSVFGNSTIDRLGCPDADGDGYSDPTNASGDILGYSAADGADALPLQPSQWNDSDGDGYGDNATGFQPDACPADAGTSYRAVFGCPDDDNDGAAQTNDAFPEESTQWADQDGDGYGDNPNGSQPDACPAESGTSSIDMFGCIDGDGDSVSDQNDLWANDSSQWWDSDNDGYGNNPVGTDGDDCPSETGTSDRGNYQGCLDSDGDGYANVEDMFDLEPSQWADSDADGWGDNETSGAYRPDHWPNNPAKNAAGGTITCSASITDIDLASTDYFSFSCTIVSELSNVTTRIEWQPITSIIASSQVKVVSFTETTTNTQMVFFSGEARNRGIFVLYLTMQEPGAEAPVDSSSITMNIFDSRVTDETMVVDETSAINDIMESPLVQAMFGGLVLFFLMGMLIIRGNAAKARIALERNERAREVLTARLNRSVESPAGLRRSDLGIGGNPPPPPPGMN